MRATLAMSGMPVSLAIAIHSCQTSFKQGVTAREPAVFDNHGQGSQCGGRQLRPPW